jgi:hypothetical protein
MYITEDLFGALCPNSKTMCVNIKEDVGSTSKDAGFGTIHGFNVISFIVMEYITGVSINVAHFYMSWLGLDHRSDRAKENIKFVILLDSFWDVNSCSCALGQAD